MSRARKTVCKYGRLKKRIGRRVCRRRPARGGRKSSRRGRRSSRGVKIAGFSLGTLAVAGIGAIGAYKFWESRGA
jgi:hypothetical protein